MHAFDLARLGGRRDPRPPRAAGRAHHDARRRRAHARPRHARHRRRDRAQAVAGVMGGAASEVSAGTTTRRVRERVLQADVGPPHEQAARPEDRGLVALRARRRHHGAGRRARARARAHASRSAPAAASAPSSIGIPRPRAAARTAPAARARIARLLGAAVADADVERILRGLGLARHAGGRRLGRRRADVPRRSRCARPISSRRSAATTASTGSRRRSRSLTAPAPAPDPADRRATGSCGAC